MVFKDEFITDQNQIKSVLDYNIEVKNLKPESQYYVALTGTWCCYQPLSG